jgi:DNA-binding response OmpR family regulator
VPCRLHGAPAVRVIVAEDEILLREGLVRLLADEGYEVVSSPRLGVCGPTW